MSNKRIFVRKREGYNKEELQLKESLNVEYSLGLDSVEIYVIYDIYNIDEETYKLAKTSVFSEVVVDDVFESIDLEDGKYFAYEVLPAQYDQRADSATQCLKLLNSKSEATVRSGKLVIFNKKLTNEQLKMIEEYLTTRENLRAVVSLVDLRHEPSADDVQMYEFLKYYEIPVILVATKADKIPRGKWNKHESMIKKKLDFDKTDTFIIFSSINKTGVEEAWDTIFDYSFSE